MSRLATSDRPRLEFHRLVAGVFALALVGVACSDGSSSGTGAPPPPTVPIPSAPIADPVETPCLSASPGFTARGTVSVLGGSGPDAAVLSGIDWVLTPGCERVVFNFFTADAAPASVIGLSRLEFFPEQAIVRVTMPRDVTSTGLADAVVDGDLVRRVYVVRSRSGELAVDLHLGSSIPIEARGLLIGSPARLVIDVRPGPPNEAFAVSPPTIGSAVVVLSPTPGAAEYPLRIRGYARTVDDVVTATLTGSGQPVPRRITAATSTDAWGEFAVTIAEGEGPSGPINLDVETEAGGSISLDLVMP